MIITVFIKRKILSVETILSTYTHAHTHARTHARAHTHTHTHPILWVTMPLLLAEDHRREVIMVVLLPTVLIVSLALESLPVSALHRYPA